MIRLLILENVRHSDSQVGLVVLGSCPPVPKIDHEVQLIDSKHKDEDLETTTPADLRESSRHQPPTPSRPGRKLAE